MATGCLTRSLPALSSLISRSVPSRFLSTASCSSFSLLRLRQLSAAAVAFLRHIPQATAVRSFCTLQTSSSLNDPNPNGSNRSPKETLYPEGCDFQPWIVLMETPDGDLSRDEIIDSYIKTLAVVVGSEEEARKKIYLVSTRFYYAFRALVPEKVAWKMQGLPNVRKVLIDSYVDLENEDFGGEPFVCGKAGPYHPKYHEEWITNHAESSDRDRRMVPCTKFDRIRIFERRWGNMQNRDFYTPMQNSPPNMGMGGGPPPPSINLQGGAPAHNHVGEGAAPSNYEGGTAAPSTG